MTFEKPKERILSSVHVNSPRTWRPVIWDPVLRGRLGDGWWASSGLKYSVKTCETSGIDSMIQHNSSIFKPLRMENSEQFPCQLNWKPFLTWLHKLIRHLLSQTPLWYSCRARRDLSDSYTEAELLLAKNWVPVSWRYGSVWKWEDPIMVISLRKTWWEIIKLGVPNLKTKPFI